MPFQIGNTHGSHKNHKSWNKGTKGLTTRTWTPEQKESNAQKNRDRVPPPLVKLGITKEQWLTARSDNKKWCSLHQKFESIDLFNKGQSCCRVGEKRTPEEHRKMNLLQYHQTPEQYEARLASQGGHCALCPSVATKRHLDIDHDHNCCPRGSCGKCIRGILCMNCNRVVGILESFLLQGTITPLPGTWLERAVNYIINFQPYK